LAWNQAKVQDLRRLVQERQQFVLELTRIFTNTAMLGAILHGCRRSVVVGLDCKTEEYVVASRFLGLGPLGFAARLSDAWRFRAFPHPNRREHFRALTSYWRYPVGLLHAPAPQALLALEACSRLRLHAALGCLRTAAPATESPERESA